MEKPYPPIYYRDYLKLDRLLDSQYLKSEEYGKPAHDEMLFIIVHQAYELWFKQMLHELDSVIAIFARDPIGSREFSVAVERLHRITEIQKVLISQLRILETMTPLDFLEFRDFLMPASGFQSLQFRKLESGLGLRPDDRTDFSRNAHITRMSAEDRTAFDERENRDSLFTLVQRWLERTPFLDFAGFNFWQAYGEAVETMLAQDRTSIESNETFSPQERDHQLAQLASTAENFNAILDESAHQKLIDDGARRLSHKATQAALLVMLYRDRPRLQEAHQLLTCLLDIDQLMTTWRQGHALMAHRMIGTKIGTGGSSGHGYLRSAADTHKVFSDLSAMSTFLIPRSALPTLPPELEKKLGFVYDVETGCA